MNDYNLEFRQIRENHKLTQTEFSRKLGISVSIIAKIETGSTNISKKIAKKVVELYPETSFKLKEYIEDDLIDVNNNTSITLSNESHLFKVIDSYTENYPIIEYYLQKIEDLKMFSIGLNDFDFAKTIDTTLENFQSNDINECYRNLLLAYSEIEIINHNNKKDQKVNEKLSELTINKKEYLNQFFVIIASQKELLKTTYEGLYDLYKKGFKLNCDINNKDNKIEILKIEYELIKRKNEILEKENLELKKM